MRTRWLPMEQWHVLLSVKSLSGITRLDIHLFLRSKPSQSGQAPNGLLKENIRGSSAPIEKPQIGQA